MISLKDDNWFGLSKIIHFFDENPKAIIIFVSCIKEAHYTQEIADEWFKKGSPIFSKDNTISKMIDEKLIMLERKEGKKHYYRTPTSAIFDVLMALYLKKNVVIQKQLKNEKENIMKFFETEMISNFFNSMFLKQTFKSSKSFEKYGLEYIDVVFSLRLCKYIFIRGIGIKKMLNVIDNLDFLFETIYTDINFKSSVFFKNLKDIIEKEPEIFYRVIEKLPKIDTYFDTLQFEILSCNLKC